MQDCSLLMGSERLCDKYDKVGISTVSIADKYSSQKFLSIYV